MMISESLFSIAGEIKFMNQAIRNSVGTEKIRGVKIVPRGFTIMSFRCPRENKTAIFTW
jgi:hypothetical protein